MTVQKAEVRGQTNASCLEGSILWTSPFRKVQRYLPAFLSAGPREADAHQRESRIRRPDEAHRGADGVVWHGLDARGC